MVCLPDNILQEGAGASQPSECELTAAMVEAFPLTRAMQALPVERQPPWQPAPRPTSNKEAAKDREANLLWTMVMSCRSEPS